MDLRRGLGDKRATLTALRSPHQLPAMSLVVPGTMLFAVFGAGSAGLAWVLFTPQAKRNDRTYVLWPPLFVNATHARGAPGRDHEKQSSRLPYRPVARLRVHWVYTSNPVSYYRSSHYRSDPASRPWLANVLKLTFCLSIGSGRRSPFMIEWSFNRFTYAPSSRDWYLVSAPFMCSTIADAVSASDPPATIERK